ncbi:hypothetical protein VDG1235_943 [Verrucomicrobiia bacterium DG1235]|nr:hypothetical protein VDG1235_943 [Verrucomicrobiae bacterium DG1235]
MRQLVEKGLRNVRQFERITKFGSRVLDKEVRSVRTRDGACGDVCP